MALKTLVGNSKLQKLLSIVKIFWLQYKKHSFQKISLVNMSCDLLLYKLNLILTLPSL